TASCNAVALERAITASTSTFDTPPVSVPRDFQGGGRYRAVENESGLKSAIPDRGDVRELEGHLNADGGLHGVVRY
ncbi:polyketide synthase, partial [Moniliophthora roreri]